MVLNEDILHDVIQLADRPTLATICLLSHATRWPASRLLYRSVRVRNLDELGALDDALTQNAALGPLVFEFFQDFSRDNIPHSDDPLALHWLQHFPRRFDSPMHRILSCLINLEAVALEDVTFAWDHTRTLLVTMLAALPRLRSVRLPGVGSPNLIRLGMSTPLEHLSIKERSPDRLAVWVLGYASTLQTLRIDNSGLLLRRLTMSAQTAVFPRLRSLIVPTERFSLAASCRTIFPDLRSLTILRYERDLPTLWPRLQHLSFTITDDDHLMPLPQVSSLRIDYSGDDPHKLNQLHQWSAHHVRALVLSCTNCGFDAHSAALRIYARLQMLEVRLPQSDNDVAEWMRRAALLPVVPPTLKVLTLRNAAEINSLDEETVDGVRARAPSLRLVRIVSADATQRRVFGWQVPLDWRGACEMVADCLPHWRETRAPWDDICDL